MHINNKAGWAETFTVAESVLCVKTGLTGRTLRNARNELKQKQRIDFTSRKGGRAPIYKIAPFQATEINSVGIAGESSGDVSGGRSGEPSTLIKLNEIKQNETNDLSYPRVVQLVQKCFVNISAKEKNMLDSYFDDMGEELVSEAINRAHLDGKRMDYALGIMKSWYKNGVKNLDDVRREDAQFEKFKQSKQVASQSSHTRYSNW